MTPAERVRAVLAVARRIADPSDALGRSARSELVRTTSLSAEGIELALTEHLEVDATDAEIEALCRSVEPARTGRAFVVLAGTVSVAPVRAVALALAAGPHVFVKASRRDPTVAGILVRQLEPALRAAGGAIRAVASVDEATAGDTVHAYGADATLASIREALPPGVLFWPHGSGFGLAVVGEGDDVERAATAVARDVVPFDQRGCLSPRVVLVEGGAARAREVALALHASLARAEESVPRGRLSDDESGEARRYVEAMGAAGEAFVGAAHVVGLDSDPSSLWLGPACRVVHVVAAPEAGAHDLVAPLGAAIAALGADAPSALARAVSAACPGARRSALGQMQRPRLDGPVDLRARAALT